MSKDPLITCVESWVGRSYAELDCWQLVQEAQRLRGVELAGDYYSALEQLETVFIPQIWDIVPLCLHRLEIGNHVGLYLGDQRFIHALAGQSASIARLDRKPWSERIARTRDGKPGFLRVRQC